MSTITFGVSKVRNKKYSVVVDGKRVDFGATGYFDYTKHRDDARKERYLQRHRAKEDWSNLKSAGFWARYVLWNKPTIAASLKDIETRFHVKIRRTD